MLEHKNSFEQPQLHIVEDDYSEVEIMQKEAIESSEDSDEAIWRSIN